MIMMDLGSKETQLLVTLLSEFQDGPDSIRPLVQALKKKDYCRNLSTGTLYRYAHRILEVRRIFADATSRKSFSTTTSYSSHMRDFSQVQNEYYVAFQDLAKECENFPSQTLRSWLLLVFSHYGTSDMNKVLAGWTILSHTELGFCNNSELIPRFRNILIILKRIDALSQELRSLSVQQVNPETAIKA
jgi:hypothetical protein